MTGPAVGLPLFIHALSGAVITGAGVDVVTSVMSPFREQILEAAKGMIIRHFPGDSQVVPVIPVKEPVSSIVADQVSTREIS
ncbi:MAG TPA: hypothetical protein VN367_02935 [Chlorobaculum sp.]|nr:hypothetical protein [Chlorobaculum sp.]